MKINKNKRQGSIKEIKPTALQLTKEKSYILGVLGPGDGFTSKSRTGLGVVDQDFAKTFYKYIKKVYGIPPSKKSYAPSELGKKRVIKVYVYARKVNDDLKKYNVNFSESEWRIPTQIKTSPNYIKHDYLSGFADSQGCVGKREICLASKNEKGMQEMLNLIRSLKINANKYDRKDTIIISIYGRHSLGYFHQHVGFKIKRKQKKLKTVLNNYKNKKYKTLRSDMIKLEPQIIKLMTQGKTQYEIAKKLEINQSVVCRKLKKWRQI